MPFVLQYDWHLLRYYNLGYFHGLKCILRTRVGILLNREVVNNPINENL